MARYSSQFHFSLMIREGSKEEENAADKQWHYSEITNEKT
jgi:hypothetical protein